MWTSIEDALRFAVYVFVAAKLYLAVVGTIVLIDLDTASQCITLVKHTDDNTNA